MKTSVREDRLLVVSDIHLGNRLFEARRRFTRFLQFCIDERYSICVNGDGVDLMQMSLTNLTRDISEVYALFRRFSASGLRIYYTVGNHDIALEHFLRDWGLVTVVPYLNVSSGPLRLRVEHGHMYDEMFLRWPRIYTGVTLIGRWLLAMDPKLYHRFEILNRALVGLGHFVKKLGGQSDEEFKDGIPGEDPSFRRAAEEISLRGFDAVVFGHTHKDGKVQLRSGATYYNTGSWLLPPRLLEIDHGRLWFGTVDDFMAERSAVSTPVPASPAGSPTPRASGGRSTGEAAKPAQPVLLQPTA